MATISISGGGDDNLLLEGDINEEFLTYSGNDGVRVVFSDGTVLMAKLDSDDEGWRIEIEQEGDGHAQVERAPVLGLDRDYTDRATVTADDLTWVEFDDPSATGQRRFAVKVAGDRAA
jgi:hypothetical protein